MDIRLKSEAWRPLSPLFLRFPLGQLLKGKRISSPGWTINQRRMVIALTRHSATASTQRIWFPYVLAILTEPHKPGKSRQNRSSTHPESLVWHSHPLSTVASFHDHICAGALLRWYIKQVQVINYSCEDLQREFLANFPSYPPPPPPSLPPAWCSCASPAHRCSIIIYIIIIPPPVKIIYSSTAL